MAPKKDSSGVYRTTVYFEGKRHTVRGKTTRELAQNKRALLTKLESGKVTVSTSTTVADWAQQWLEAYCKDSLGEGTYKNYKGIIRNQINPALGALRLKDVTPMHCQRALNAQRGHSTSFLTKVRSVMVRMFKQARRSKLILDNPADDLALPSSTDGRRRSVTPEEREAILAVAETHPAGLYIKMMLYCGLRPGECIPLQWVDIDLDAGMIDVHKALKRGSETVGAPKSKAGSRRVPIPAAYLPDLNAAYTGNPFDYVFVQPTTGKMQTRMSQRCAWMSFRRALDIYMGAEVYRNQLIVHALPDDLCQYCLRHTYGTDLQDSGVPINVAKYLMGHSDISTTADIYTDTSDEAIEQARRRVDEHNRAKPVQCMSKCMSTP